MRLNFPGLRIFHTSTWHHAGGWGYKPQRSSASITPSEIFSPATPILLVPGIQPIFNIVLCMHARKYKMAAQNRKYS